MGKVSTSTAPILKDGHHALAELLQQREVIYTEDAERIFGPRQWKSRTEEMLKDSDNHAEPEQPASDDNVTLTPPPFEQNN